ncbi:MAG: M55 family metallopeptidase [Ignavibacteriales bacterium]
MKIYISADLEGISGVVSPEQTMPEYKDYAMSRELMTGDVNAAIQGLRQAGVDEIVVNDSHHNSRTIDITALDPGAVLISGDTRKFSMMHGLDESFDGAILLGYHARAGTAGAIMDHSYYAKSVLEIRIDGVAHGEIGINTLYAAEMGVPVLLVTGDRAAAAEAVQVNPRLRTVCVKEAQGRFCAKCLPIAASRKMITEAAREAAAEAAVSRREIGLPAVPSQPVLEIDFPSANLADAACVVPGTERISNRGIRFQCKSVKDLFLWRQVFCALAASAQNKHY